MMDYRAVMFAVVAWLAAAVPSYAATPVSLSADSWEVIQGTGTITNASETVPGVGDLQVLSTAGTGGLGFEVRQTNPYGQYVLQRYLKATLRTGASFSLRVNVRGVNGTFYILQYNSAPGAVTRTASNVLKFSLAADYQDRYNAYETFTLDLARDFKRLVPETDFHYARWISVRGSARVGVLEFSNTFAYLSQNDTDRDGLNDLHEETVSLTSPFLADSDGDGFRDGIEYGRACAAPLDAAVPSAPSADSDGDGLRTLAELFLGANCTVADDAALPTAFGWSIYAPAPDGVVAPAGDGSISLSHTAVNPQALGAWIAGPGTPYAFHLNIARSKLAFKVKSAEKFDVRVLVRGSDNNKYYLMYPYTTGAPNVSGSEVRYPLRTLGYIVGGAGYTTVTRNLNADLAGLVPGVTVQKILYVLARGRMNLKDIYFPPAAAAPVMASAVIGTGYTVNSTIVSNVSATDADGDPISYLYQWFVNGVAAPGQTGAALSGAFSMGDQVYVRVTPTDGTLTGLALNSNTTTIGNSVPSLSSVSIASVGNPAYGTDATLYVDSWAGLSDLDAADTPALLYQWYVNGVPVVGQTGRILTGYYLAKGDTVYAQAVPIDGQSAGLPVNSGSAVVGNTPPTLMGVGVNFGIYYFDTPIAAFGYGVGDADGDVTILEYRWFVDGVPQGTSSGTLSTGYSRGQTVFTAARAFDGNAYSGYVSSPVVSIQNRKPAIDTLALSATPGPAAEGATLSYAATSHDPDAGDTVTLQPMWLVNGSATGITAATVTGAIFEKGDVVAIRITPYDGLDSGTPMIASLTIANTRPTPAGITLYPSPMVIGDNIYVKVTTASTDVDSVDSVGYTYQWFKNGAAQPFANSTTLVSSGLLSPGEEWKVVVTPTDGFADGVTTWAVKKTPTVGIFLSAAGLLTTARRFHTATVLPNGKVLIAGGITQLLSELASAELYDPVTDTFTATGSLGVARGRHTATLLPNGKVLIAGGNTSTATGELYDSATGTFAPTVALGTARYSHTATLLPNGKVLIAGGSDAVGNELATAGLYDPATGTFATTGNLGTARTQYSATLLPNGKVLMVGGKTYAVSAELYDPATGTFSVTGAPGTNRYQHTATLLPSGKVLIAGDLYGGLSAQLYDPNTGTFTVTGSLGAARAQHTATLLPNGTVLIAGGTNGSATGELYDPITGTFSVTGTLVTARSRHTANVLPNGRVLIAGGSNLANSAVLTSAELFDPQDPAPLRFTATGSLDTARYLHSATLLPTGKVLIAGGHDGSVCLSGAELYDPVTDTLVATGSLAVARAAHTTTVLPNGKVLVTGGACHVDYLTSAELYDPATATFTLTGSLGAIRSEGHTSTLLPNGKVLIAGGDDGMTYFASAELYDSATSTFTATGTLGTARSFHTATLLPNGKVLVAGGYNGAALDGAELYDPTTGVFAATGSLGTARDSHTSTLLPTGNVLIVGGQDDGTEMSEIYNPATGTFADAASILVKRWRHTATLLPAGTVLIVGGIGFGASMVNESLLYAVTTGTWTGTNNYGTARAYHTANVLPDGRVLVTGGFNGAFLTSAELFR